MLRCLPVRESFSVGMCKGPSSVKACAISWANPNPASSTSPMPDFMYTAWASFAYINRIFHTSTQSAVFKKNKFTRYQARFTRRLNLNFFRCNEELIGFWINFIVLGVGDFYLAKFNCFNATERKNCEKQYQISHKHALKNHDKTRGTAHKQDEKHLGATSRLAV
jgi:hypothetical protein